MERETPEPAAPATFLRSEEEASPESVRARFERMIRRVQAEVCAELEVVEGGAGGGGGAALFREDAWTRPGGGGGISRVFQGGRVFEKAAVNVSVVYGVMPPEAYRAARPEAAAAAGGEKAGPVPFFAAGVSSVIHPVNPFAPTMHFNYRYFETEAPKDAPGAPRQWWFGGGTDLTPSYIIEEDVKHFHSVYDRGTTFGLKTGGRIESILVSLPLTARWEYDNKPEVGSEEWKLLDTCINPKEWI
nr:unnamed protein product [Digitaria exilis]